MRRRLAGTAVLALTLPLAACTATASAAGGVDLLRAGCPVDIRIATDDLPGVEWGFLYGLLDADRVTVRGDEVSAPLLVDGRPTGTTLTIVTGDPLDGDRANVALHDDESLLLGAVDTDVALLDAVRYPTVGVFAPLIRDPRVIFWDSAVYPGLTNVDRMRGTLLPDSTGLVPVALPADDPFLDYAVGIGWLDPEQLVEEPEFTVAAFTAAAGLRMQAGDAFTDPYLLGLEAPAGYPGPVRTQLLDATGYTRDAGVLSARPQALVRYADCLHTLVPVLQRSLAGYLAEPEAATALMVEVSAELGHPEYDAPAAAVALNVLIDDRFAGTGRDDTVGDIDVGRLRELFERAVPEWRDAGIDVPRHIVPDDIVTNDFIDRAIG